MAYKELISLLPPPVEVFNGGSVEEWRRFQDYLGILLPTDYRKFVTTYGSGTIDNFLWVLNPFTRNDNLNLFLQTKVICEAYVTSKKKFPEDFPHEVYPKQGGLLPWAVTDNGDELYWITQGEPESWPIVIYETRSPFHVIYNISITDFIYKLVSRELTCPIFPDDFPSDIPHFISLDM